MQKQFCSLDKEVDSNSILPVYRAIYTQEIVQRFVTIGLIKMQLMYLVVVLYLACTLLIITNNLFMRQFQVRADTTGKTSNLGVQSRREDH